MALIYYVTQIQFEFGAIKLLKQECERVGISRPLIVTDAGVKAAGVLQKALDALTGMRVAVFDQTPSNPTEAAVREVFEEVGLEVALFHDDCQPIFNENKKSIIPPQYMLRIPFEGMSDHVTFVYFAKSESDVLK
ncbi:MAG: iron-containing alcohol dehydrogenase, partial [Rhodoferax sp.]|nr:iron-containing alcohol dehydrogenase [Rhodoferax sp.]